MAPVLDPDSDAEESIDMEQEEGVEATDYDENDFNQGIILPPLIVQLKKILEQYPDDSQILKELIQNAEDAGARVVKFLYDRHSYGRNTKSLKHPGLSKFQGPALYTYNDALFDENDWKGIRMLCQSVKQNDPLKVGYFGMGFKSIFHITDLPSILSGERLGIIDPHQKFFPASTHSWALDKHPDLLEALPDQFAPYLGIFDCTKDTFSQGFYDGSLFRFPLRTNPSALSDTLYSYDRVQGLYESFYTDAHRVLLFLKNLERVELYERDEKAASPRLLYRVQIREDCLQEVRQKRSEFINKAKTKAWLSNPLVSSYPVIIETVQYIGKKEESHTYRYLVTNYFSGGNVSSIFRQLHRDQDLNYPPWVGVAMPLDLNGEDDPFELTEDDGHVFCFLPIQLEKKTPTGLPVHVNGFFALEQNRKYLKWPGSNHRSDMMDKRLLWNQCLLKEALPKAYAELLLSAINLNRVQGDNSLAVSIIYRAFPDFSKVDRKWATIVVPMYSELFQNPVVHTRAQGGSWIEPRGAVFNTLSEDEETVAVLLDILSKGEVLVADVPPHVLNAIKTCCRINLAKITPQIISASYRDVQFNSSFTYPDKIALLRFLLRQMKYELLDGLELLPLANGGFEAFSSNPRRAEYPIFIPTPEHPHTLLPGLENILLDPDLEGDLKQILARAANRGYTQLKPLDKDLVMELLPRCLPHDWLNASRVTWTPGRNGHPPYTWLEEMWTYFQKYHRHDLSSVEQLPLIPVAPGKSDNPDAQQPDSMELVPLYTFSGLIVRQMDGLALEEGIDEVLKKLGITVLEELPQYIRSHPLVTRFYVNSPSSIGILRTIIRACEDSGYEALCQSLLESTTTENKRTLRRLFSRMSPYDLKPDHRTILSRLPLLETLEGSGMSESHFVSVEDVNLSAPVETLPVHISRMLLDNSTSDSANLSELLHVKQLSVIELLKEIVFPDIESAYYEPKDVETVMLYVLRHFHVFCDADKTFIDCLRSLPFLPRKDMFVTPDRFFDPDQELLQKLFIGEENFPTGPFAEHSMVAILQKLGLRGVDEVDPEDLQECAFLIQDITKGEVIDSDMLNTKSSALLDYITKYPHKLSEPCDDSTLSKCLSGIRWVQSLQTKPTFYPKKLTWYEGTYPCERPQDMKSSQFSSVIGSAMAIVAREVPQIVAEQFGWTEPPNLDYIVVHLGKVVDSYSAKEKAKFMEISTKIYQEFVKYPQDVILDTLHKHDVRAWIWQGEGFTRSGRVVFREPFADLRPFVYSLPVEVSAFSDLFERCGVRQKSHLPDVMQMIKAKYEHQEKQMSRGEIKRDLHLSISILNELKSHVTEIDLSTLQADLVLPIHVEHDATIKMAPLNACTYCDQEWLRQGHDLGDLTDEGEEEILFVHPNIPNSTSEALEVPTLMSRMLDAEELDFSFGQTDSLTHRLNVLLQEYTDGFAIPKELVQNADDAGATEVKILYDERHNEDAQTCLIDEGMRECQGPAIWAYNDAVFTDEDFENITKLSGATKETKTEKIGRFGLGFNAVYNLTDVPSFISRHNIVIFDPHTSHLGKSIKNKSKPGIKIDMRKHRKKLRRLGNQFKPYNNIFGCDLRPETNQESYNSTLFRFPLRTKPQAIKSEICQRHYDDKEVRALLHMLVKGAESLLLFTQNIMKISVYHLPSHARDPREVTEIFHVAKGPLRILRELEYIAELPPNAYELPEEQQEFLRQNQVLKASTVAMQSIRQKGTVEGIVVPKSSMLINMESAITISGSKFLQRSNDAVSCPWLVCSCLGVGDSLRMALMEENMMSTAGVAVPMAQVPQDGSYVPRPIYNPTDQNKHHGTVFMFLPLPIHNGLPVHINGGFAVTSNRRHLCERNEDDKFDMRAVWNEALMEDAICDAYMMMLEDITRLANPAFFYFTSLWPRIDSVEGNSRQLLMSLYREIARSDDSAPPLFSDNWDWVQLKDCVFLESSLRNSKVGEMAIETFRECLMDTEKKVIDLPLWVMEGFQEARYSNAIKRRSYDLIRFLEEIVMPNILNIDLERRDSLVLYALEQNNVDVDQILMKYTCIPVSPYGDILKAPADIVDPSSELASLYSPEDGRFPYGSQTFASTKFLAMLKRLSMATEDISWKDIEERAESIINLDYTGARRRTASLLSFINKKIAQDSVSQMEEEELEKLQDRLRNIPFLSIMQRPVNYPMALPWKGEEYPDDRLVPASELFPAESLSLVCFVEPIVDESLFPKQAVDVKQFLNLKEKNPGSKRVLEQLDLIIQTRIGPKDKELAEEVRKVTFATYKYLQDYCEPENEEKEELVNYLRDKQFIFCHGRFLRPVQVAFDFPHYCAPYLYGLPDSLKRALTPLFSDVGVREQFESKDFVETLQSMHDHHGDRQLDKDSNKLALLIVNLLNDSLGSLNQTLVDVVREHGHIFIPDSGCVLRSADELCYNEPECSWLPRDAFTKYSHPHIPFAISKQLGVNTRRQEVLKKHSKGIPFGQRERLTNRIKRILSSYPCDKEIMKELLQNADDAGATNIHFINDPRYHGTERVFDECWKPLQGPALCVYNNSPFTERDLEGIQNLGEGSKSLDPNKTGQYGVGFNCVYHLTDAPSFLTCGSEIGETLCIFDPHGTYVPGASTEEPGRRYDDVLELRPIFRDVFPTYLEDRFNMKDATMFRFPLRTDRMAATSELSDKSISSDAVENLLAKFRNESFDCLLFINNIQTISMSSIDKMTNRISNTYTVKVEMADEDYYNRKQFSEYLKDISAQVKNGEINIWDIPPQEATYTMTLRDNKGYWETWMVTQKIGFDNTSEIPASVFDTFRRGDLALLPRGGVAALLDTANAQFGDRPKRAFCFLPLPLKTSLPVQINGHFALDHEARRNLWMDEDMGAKTEWNFTILNQIIAKAYVSVLRRTPSYLSNSMLDGSTSLFSTQDGTIPNLEFYSSLFPRFSTTDPYWTSLVGSVYKLIDCMQEPVLPVVKSPRPQNLDMSSLDSMETIEDFSQVEVEWVSTTGSGMVKPSFDDLDETFFGELDGNPSIVSTRSRSKYSPPRKAKKDVLRRVLLASGFKLLKLPLDVYQGFKQAGVDVECISPASVLHFYSTYSSHRRLCDIGYLPAHINDTPFRNVSTLMILLQYCMQDVQSFFSQIDGLPLLLCEDNQMRMFSSQEPVYLTSHQDVLQQCGTMFIHRSLVDFVFGDVQPEDYPVFQRFDISAMANLLGNTISDDFYRNTGCHVTWNPRDEDFLPNSRWIRTLWSFIREESRRTTEGQDLTPAEFREHMNKMLEPVKEWCLLPASIPPQRKKEYRPRSYQDQSEQESENLLVPIGMTDTVLDFANAGIMSYSTRDVLKKLGVPELNTKLLEGYVASPVHKPNSSNNSSLNLGANSDLARLLVANLENPSSLLHVLDYVMVRHSIDGILNHDECTTLLKYFNDCVKSWMDDASSTAILRELPFFLTVHGELTKLNHNTVFVLPNDIPTADMHVWEKEAGIVFIRRNKSLTELHTTLGCLTLSTPEVYTKFIFTNFNLLSPEARITHLLFLKESKLPQMDEVEKTLLIGGLKHLEFLPDSDGLLRRACHYYDPYHPVFKAMLAGEPDAFPHRPFCEFKWLDFLRQIGLQYVITPEMLVDFCVKIANEARMGPTESTFDKSRTLINHMYRRHNLATEKVLHRVAEIAFVPPAKISTILQKIHNQYGTRIDGGHKYIAFRDAIPESHEYLVWTSGHIIPDWANPMKLTPNDVNFSYEEDHMLHGFENYKDEIAYLLGIKGEPPVESVVEHVKNICCHMNRKLTNDELRAFMLVDVMKMVYKYLKTTAMDDDTAKDALQDIPCIVVDLGYTLVKPSQVVINLYEEDQITPYLYKAPTELGEFKQVFLDLGATSHATVDQYAMVLERIFHGTRGARMHPNEMKATFKAVRGLFDALQKRSEEYINSETLYLPSTKATLVEAKELVFNDDPSYTDRITNFAKPFLLDLTICQVTAVNYEDLIKLLPEQLQPVMLTTLVQEILEESSRDTLVDYGIAEKLRHQLNSKAFSLGIARLIRHEHHRSRQRVQQNVLDNIQEQLKLIRVFGVERVMTYLSYEGERIPGSEVESECFVDKTYDEEQEGEVWNIYVDNLATMSEELLVSVAEVINRIIGGILKNSVHYLQPILSCPPHSVYKVLDRLKIRPDHSVDFRQPTLPTTGNFIPIEDHHLLKDDLDQEFQHGEYVGFELEDDLESGVTFIYAIIMEKIPVDENDPNKRLNQKYKINIGDDRKPITASVVDLYKFHRVDEFMPRNVSVAESSTSADHSSQSDQRDCSVSAAESVFEEGQDEFLPTIDEEVFDVKPPAPQRTLSDQGQQRRRSGSHSHAEEENFRRHSGQDDRHRESPQDKPHSQNQNSKEKNFFDPQDFFQNGFNGHADFTQTNGHGGNFFDQPDFGPHASTPKSRGYEPDHTDMPEPEVEKTLEDVFEEVSDVLDEAWTHLEPERKKVIKRLLLKWHPDKNIGNEDFCTQVTQHIQAEIERLEQGLPRKVRIDPEFYGFTPGNPFSQSESFQANFKKYYDQFYADLNNRAKSHKKQREEYKENFSREYTSSKSSSSFNFDVPPTFTSCNPQPTHARRFFRQAEADIKAADNDMDAEEPAYEWVVFKCYQASEKAFKAAQLSVDALHTTSHDLPTIASNIEDSTLRLLAMKFANFIVNPNKLYNPDPIDYVIIPHDEFSRQMALDAYKMAKQILEKVWLFIEPNV